MKRTDLRVCCWVALTAALVCFAAPASAQYKPRTLDDPATGEKYRIEGGADFWFPTADMVVESEQLGIPVRGVSFPAHFLLRVTTPDGDVMLDPTTGHSLSESAMVEMLEPYVQRVGESIGSALRILLQPATRREIIGRMLRNLKSIYLQTERWQRLLAVQQRLVILMPESIEEVRDRGFAYARLDYLRPAMEDLRRYLDDRPDAEDATVVETELHELRQRTQHNGE